MKKLSFKAAVNWDFVHAHHPIEAGKIKPGPWLDSIIEHARRRGFAGNITPRGAARVANQNLY
jgi:hypothetical protein